MTKAVIVIEDAWKKYRIGAPKKMTDALSGWFSDSFRGRHSKVSNNREFWALKGIDLKICQGEVVGIVGPNGSGKSTLLKMLSGITFPTKGQVSVDGKVASLLELGNGFHPELTGRENIYLYGAVIGMRKKEIDNKMAEIISFSGVENFLETPVKHYSSGMYIRLAFSVTVHLDFDILLIDEILAVGDAEFQKKSFSKLQEIVKRGKTIVIVSHDLDSIRKLCTSALLIKGGRVEKTGKTDVVVSSYIKGLSRNNT